MLSLLDFIAYWGGLLAGFLIIFLILIGVFFSLATLFRRWLERGLAEEAEDEDDENDINFERWSHQWRTERED